MFAYIQNNKIFCISSEKLTEEFLQNIDSLDNLTVIKYSDNIQNPILSEDGKNIIEAQKEETNEEKFARIFQKICSPEIVLNAETDHSILEWVEFSDTAIGDVIATRVFLDEKTGKWNPHGQMAMIAKIIADPALANSAEVQKKAKEIDDIRLFFGLSRMTPEARTAFRSRQ